MNRDTALSLLDAIRNKTLLTSRIEGLSSDHKISRAIVAANEVVATAQPLPNNAARMKPNYGVSRAFFRLLVNQFPVNKTDIETIRAFWSDNKNIIL